MNAHAVSNTHRRPPRLSRTWRRAQWAMISLGVIAVVVAPILYVTTWSRATGVAMLIVGIPVGLAGLALPFLGRRTRIAVASIVAAVSLLSLVAALWTVIYSTFFGYDRGA